MLTDRYELPLSTASSAARDAYVQGCEAKLTMYPGALEPIAGELERIGGSRAQLDLAEFTLLNAYLGASRLEDARRMVSVRLRGSSGIFRFQVCAAH